MFVCQVVDDVLDFEGSVQSLGKPALADLNAGLATAPVLLAAEEHPSLVKLIERKFDTPGDVEAVRVREVRRTPLKSVRTGRGHGSEQPGAEEGERSCSGDGRESH
jgi:hypothetical protein